MRILNDFLCSDCALLTESLEQHDTREVSCPECGGKAFWQISAPTIDPNPFVFGESASSAAIDKWAKNRRKKITQEERHSSFEAK